MVPQPEDMSAEVDDLLLPPVEVTVRPKQSGAQSVLLVFVGLALAPFVQAVAESLGSKLGDTIDASARGAVRRLLQRVHHHPEIPPEDPWFADGMRITVSLLDEDSGARVYLDDNLPAEAVAQLLKMSRGGTQRVRGSVYWLPKGAPDGRWYVEDEGRPEWAWDSAAQEWKPVQ
ncbi:hypothetical protein [Streptomyces sp. NPDC002133]|uniref:hypothetical protein n=1 Tax=Streptomyces sp. NPDC002133 TaxID=3154409 RepID=UPI00332B4D3C